MKIGMIVDGQAEYRSLAKTFPRIETDDQLLNPLYADIQPKARPEKLVRAALPSLRLLAKKRAQLILIILDHENRPECVPNWRRISIRFGILRLRVQL